MQQRLDPAPPPCDAGARDFVHKLNNLLTVVLGDAENSLSSDDPAEMKRALESIATAADSMAEVLRGFAKACSAPNASLHVRQRIEGSQR